MSVDRLTCRIPADFAGILVQFGRRATPESLGYSTRNIWTVTALFAPIHRMRRCANIAEGGLLSEISMAKPNLSRMDVESLMNLRKGVVVLSYLYSNSLKELP
jgi:hypothetical protein